ncbi:transport integral membrane protein [Microlunatus endophyticus]|uniref:Transport integral membrane protein n=1 Tax=Microlunatus endophyticus TaxID=1716077 RepID=A0A917S9W8_9ACTN|nr:copper resistance protein CopC [Microlunatus endophyticus]GGL66431.1 transport integral membrane protein [Microlunatus endophyticus]
MLPRTIRIIGALLATVPVALLIIVAGSPAASAHAVLVGSDPLDGSRLATIPARVTLRFDEPVQIIDGGTTVISTAGGRVETGAPVAGDGGRSVIINLDPAPGKKPATYLVSYRIVSADSHVVVGSIRFGVAQDPTAIDQPAQAGAGPPGVVSAIGTGLTYAGVVGAIGCLAAGFLLWPSALRSRRLNPVIIGGPVLIMVGTLARLIAAAPAAEGTGWSGMLQLEGLPFTLIGYLGRMLAVQFTLAAALLPLSRAIRPRRGDQAADPVMQTGWALAAIALIGVMAASGHGGAGNGRWFALPATALHLAAMAIWIGGVIDLLLVVRPRLRTLPRTTGMIIDRWSRLAFAAVAALALSGELLAWRQIQPIEALWRTPYGITLLIKLGLAAVAVIIGWFGSRVAARRRDLTHTRRMLVAEIMIMVLVIAAATVLSATPAARDQYGPSAQLSAPFGGDQLNVRVAGTRRGPQQIIVRAVDAAGRPLPIRSLSGQLSSVQAQVAAVDVRFRSGSGEWHSTDATMPLPGLWQLTLTVTPESGPAYVTEVSYRVW